MNINIKQSIITSLGKFSLAFDMDKGNSIVLCYHSVSGSKDKYSVSVLEFERQILELSKYFVFVSLDDLFSEKVLKKPGITLTLDDGYKNALKIVNFTKKNNIPVTLFVLSNPKQVNRKELGNKNEFLSFDEIRQLKKAGWTIGCHSATHSNFQHMDAELIEKEIVESKRTLERKIESRIDYFAYPKGVTSKTLQEAVKKAGFKAAFTAAPGVIRNNSKLFALPRFVMENKNVFIIPHSFTETVDRIRKVGGLFYAN